MSSLPGERRFVRPPREAEHLPCPRCKSTHTKFCYYNNYNLSQPRHFCKSCRRYWTQGGTLRNIPVGGGSRKNPPSSKRSRLSSDTAAIHSLAAASSVPVSSSSETEFWTLPDPIGIDVAGGFSFGISSFLEESLLGRGEDFGLEEMGNLSVGGNTWQMGSGEGTVETDCFPWPELVISTPGEGVV